MQAQPEPTANATQPISRNVRICGTVHSTPIVAYTICPQTLRTVPVLQIKLQTNDHTTPVLVQQTFPHHAHSGAQAAARRYQKGTVLCVEAPVASISMVARDVQHISIQPSQQNTKAAA